MDLNFNKVGTCFSFNCKLKAHIEAENENRVKDYICEGYTYYNPSKNISYHPCFDMIKEGVQLLKNKGWRIYPAKSKEWGIQIYLESPEGKIYHSHYNYDKKGDE